VALCAARRFDSRSLHVLSLKRGRLMAAGTGDRGAMLAVQAPLETIDSVLRENGLDLILANKNSPRQTVLSGSTEQIERATQAFTRRGVSNRRLPVAAAFHSRFVSEAREQFQAVLDRVEWSPAQLPVFANTTAQEYPHDSREARKLLAAQLAEPVEFVREVLNMYDAGVRTFLEVGPSNKLSGLVAAILEDKADFQVVAVDASSGKRSGQSDLARALAHLAAAGQSVQLARWDEDKAPKPRRGQKPALTVPICGANYVKP